MPVNFNRCSDRFPAQLIRLLVQGVHCRFFYTKETKETKNFVVRPQTSTDVRLQERSRNGVGQVTRRGLLPLSSRGQRRFAKSRGQRRQLGDDRSPGLAIVRRCY